MKRVSLVLMMAVLLGGSAWGAEEKLAVTNNSHVAAGRQAFIEFKCASCHQVFNDALTQEPITSPAPILGGLNKLHTAEELAKAIALPSHSIAEGFKANPDGSSKMLDLSSQMTVRQLLDIVSYLERAEETDAAYADGAEKK